MIGHSLILLGIVVGMAVAICLVNCLINRIVNYIRRANIENRLNAVRVYDTIEVQKRHGKKWVIFNIANCKVLSKRKIWLQEPADMSKISLSIKNRTEFNSLLDAMKFWDQFHASNK
jgi:hypothetical protein